MTDLLYQRLGNYHLERLIGQGGFALVYLGEHVHLGTKAALKVLRVELDEEEQERFLQEARLIARLIHPHIIRVLDYGIEGATPFLVMEYAAGGSLRQRYPKGSRHSAQEVLPFLQQAASALQYAHDQQVIHRDVKPENLLLKNSDELMLGDFGIALIAQSTHGASSGGTVGTAAYMAPEQIQGHPQMASDQYSLGIILYEWLSGDWPFNGTFTEVCSQHLFASPPPLREKLPQLSPAVEAVVERALAKKPEERFPSVEALANAFAEACQDEMASPSDDATVRRSLLIAPTKYVEQPSLKEALLPPTQRAEKPDESLPSLPSSPVPAKGVMSRRNLLIGGGILVAAVGVGGLVWLRQDQLNRQAASEQFTAPPSPTSSTTSPPGVGTTIYTYQQHQDTVYTVAWSPNGEYMVSGSADTTARVWKTSKDETLYTYQGHAGLLNAVMSVSWASNGRWIASGSTDQTVQIWEAATGNRIQMYRGHIARVLTVAWSPDATSVASGSADKTIQVWEATTGKLLSLYQMHRDAVYTVAWSPDGTLLASGSSDKTVQVWEPITQKLAAQYQHHTGAVYALAWSPDGNFIASGGADRTVQIWEARTAKPYHTLQGSTDLTTAISAVSWSSDGSRIAAASTESTVQVWEAKTGKHLFTYQEQKGAVYALAWMPDGPYIASGGADRTVKIWRGM
jgi:eukaryotic-like serine/threonine-protein kinase